MLGWLMGVWDAALANLYIFTCVEIRKQHSSN